MLTAVLLFPDQRASKSLRGGRGSAAATLYTVTADVASSHASSAHFAAVGTSSVPRGAVSIAVSDTSDHRAKKDAVCDMIASSREDLCRTIVGPLVTSIVPPSPAHIQDLPVAAAPSSSPLHAQGTIVVDGSTSARHQVLFDPYDGLLVSAIRDLATRESTKAVFLSAVELDEHNQLIDLLSADSRAQRSASPGVALRAGVVRNQIPTVVEDTTDKFTAIEETTFEDVSKDCHTTLQYLASKCQGDARHQVFSVVVVHRSQHHNQQRGGGGGEAASANTTTIANTTIQFVSLVVNEVTRGTRATRHCVQNVASLLESRSNAVSFTSTKVLFLLKPALTGKQPGAWITLLDPTGSASLGDSGSAPPPVETFKDAFAVLQTLGRVSGAARSGSADCLLWNNPAVGSGPSSLRPTGAISATNRSNMNTHGVLQTSTTSHYSMQQHNLSTVSSTHSANPLDSTVRRASRLTEEIDKRFQQLSGALPPSLNTPTTTQPIPRRSASISSSDLEPRQQHPTPQHTPPVSMSRNQNYHNKNTTSRSQHTTPVSHQRASQEDTPSNRRRARTPPVGSARQQQQKHLDEMQRRMQYLDHSESQHHRRGEGATLVHAGMLDDDVDDDFYHSKRKNRNGPANLIRRGKETQSPYRNHKHTDDDADNDDGGGEYSSSATSQQIQRLKSELAKEKHHSSQMLHNYETYKHTMEGVLLRLRKDVEAQSIKLEDTQKQLRLRDKVLRNGNDGHQHTTRELESVTTKLRLLEETHQGVLADHQQQKSAWKAQRVELHKSNDQLQRRVSDLLETVNGLEGLLAKSQDHAASRTKGLTMSATTMTTISGLVNVANEAVLQKIAQDGGGGGFYACNSGGSSMYSPQRDRGSGGAVLSGQNSFIKAGAPTFAPGVLGVPSANAPNGLISQIPTVGIPRGTQTTFPTFHELQHDMREKDLQIESQQEDIVRLSDNVALMTSREHSLHKRIEELEMDVSALEEREIAAKSTLLKTEQLLRVERQESDRKRFHREANAVSTGCQATPAPELHDILMNDLEVANAELQKITSAAKHELEVARGDLADATREYEVSLAEKEAEYDATRGTLERALEDQRDEHSSEMETLRERIYTLENMLEEQRLRSTNVSPQSLGSIGLSPTEQGNPAAGMMMHHQFLPAATSYAIEVPSVYRGSSHQTHQLSVFPPTAAVGRKGTSPPSGRLVSVSASPQRRDFPASPPLHAATGARHPSVGSPMVSTTQRKPSSIAAASTAAAGSHSRTVVPTSASHAAGSGRVAAVPSLSASPGGVRAASTTSTLLASPPVHQSRSSLDNSGGSPQGLASPNTQFNQYMSRAGVAGGTTSAPNHNRSGATIGGSGGGILKRVPPPGSAALGTQPVAKSGGGGGILRR